MAEDNAAARAMDMPVISIRYTIRDPDFFTAMRVANSVLDSKLSPE